MSTPGQAAHVAPVHAMSPGRRHMLSPDKSPDSYAGDGTNYLDSISSPVRTSTETTVPGAAKATKGRSKTMGGSTDTVDEGDTEEDQ